MKTPKSATVALPNYSKEQEARITESAPLDWDIAKALAVEFGKSPQSVVSKCKSMKVEYKCKPAPTKKVAKVTKLELVAQIESTLDRKLAGLEKSTSQALLDLINGIDHIKPLSTD